MRLIWAIIALCIGCGSPPNVGLRPTQEITACDRVKDPESPFIVEWSAAERGDLESMSGEGIVLVRYDGCQNLKILTECSAAGGYRFKPFTSPRLDSVTMKTRQDLYAALPVGAANIEASLGDGGTVDLRYVLVGTQRSTSRPERGKLMGRCSGATHYVSSMSMGAFSLEKTSQRRSSAEAGLPLVGGAGGQRKDQRAQLRMDGDVDACAETRTCRSAVRVTLAPLDQPTNGTTAGAPALSTAAAPITAPRPTSPDVVGLRRRGGTLKVGLPTRMGARFNLSTRVGNMNAHVKEIVLQRLASADQRGVTKLKLLDKRVVSKDGKTIRLTLKKGLNFHTHKCVPKVREATAKDLLYSIETFRSFGRLDLTFAPGKPVVLEDRYTVKLSLADRDVYLDQSLTEISLIPHELEGCADLKEMEQLVGTGPFKMSKISPSGYARLERHTAYWERDDAGQTLPYLDAIEYSTATNVSQAMGQLYEGKLDLYFGLRSQLSPHFTDGQALKPLFKDPAVGQALGVGLDTAGTRHARFLGFYPVGTQGPLGDKRVRRAIALAIDRETVAASIHTKSVPAGRLLDESLLGFEPRLDAHRLDRKAARTLLAKAGYAKGKGLKTMIIGAPQVYRDAAEKVVDSLREIGVPARIVGIVQNKVVEMVNGGQVDAMIGDFGYGFASDEAPSLLDLLRLHALKATPTGGIQELDTPRALEIVRTLSSMADREERRKAFADIERAIIEEAKPFIPIARMSMEHGVIVVLYNRRNSAWFNPLTGQMKTETPALWNAPQ